MAIFESAKIDSSKINHLKVPDWHLTLWSSIKGTIIREYRKFQLNLKLEKL